MAVCYEPFLLDDKLVSALLVDKAQEPTSEHLLVEFYDAPAPPRSLERPTETSHSFPDDSSRCSSSISSTSSLKRVRKREQNKSAATRYRLKKRAELDEILAEERRLARDNRTLWDKAEEVEREVRYLKGLMRELLQAKGFV